MSKTNNQKYKKLFQTVCEATINAPKEAFNLHDWVFTLSDKDYQTKPDCLSSMTTLDQMLNSLFHKAKRK